MRRALFLAVMCAGATACANLRSAEGPQRAYAPVGAAPVRGTILGNGVAISSSGAVLPGTWRFVSPAPAPTYTYAPASSSGVPDYTYAGPSILSERESAVDDDDGPPPPRSFMTLPMGNGATIIAGDINGIALPMGNGTLWSFE